MLTKNKQPALAGAGQLMMLFGASSTTSNSDLTTMAAPRVRSSCTSRQAAEEICGHLGRLEARVLAALHDAGRRGLADFELQQRLSLSGSTQRPRRRRLVELGLVCDSGFRRRTSTGRQACVWIAALEALTRGAAP